MSVIKNEEELFIYLKDSIPDLTKAEDDYEVYDFYSVEKQSLFEVKARQKHYDFLVIERAKYENVLNAASELDYTPYYVNSTPEGVFAFNLTAMLEPEWSIKAMPKTTSFTDRSFKKKVVGYLDVCSAMKI